MTGKRTPPTMTHDEMVEKMLSNPAVKAEYDAIADEFALLDEMLAARKEAGLTQAEVAERMGTKATAITRMESNLASGTSGPSFATLKKFARATGKKLQIRFVYLSTTAPSFWRRFTPEKYQSPDYHIPLRLLPSQIR